MINLTKKTERLHLFYASIVLNCSNHVLLDIFKKIKNSLTKSKQFDHGIIATRQKLKQHSRCSKIFHLH